MKKMMMLFAAASLLSLSACAVHTPHGSVVVDPDYELGHGGHHGGRFCPPGQAKKGNC